MASNIKITFLGTGGSWPSPGRGMPAVSLQIDEVNNLLDCGEGTQKQMMKLGVSFMSVDNVFITHFHGDHFLGLLGLVQSMSFNGRTSDLNIYGPKGAINILSSALNIGYYRLSFKIKVAELDPGATYDFGKFYVDTLKNDHTVPAISYRFREKDLIKIDREKVDEVGVPLNRLEELRRDGQVTVRGKTYFLWQVAGGVRRGRRVVYTGDTRPFEGMVEFAKDVDVLIHETTTDSSLEPKVNEFGHSSSRQAAEIAKKANVKRLLLFHYSPRYESPEPMLNEAKSIFPNSEASREGMTLDVPIISSR
ncbi:MAG: ribonuclease Z [Thermoplasmataceae archaeon]